MTAHLEGRRSLEESLALYPGLRSELEPLLRTTVDVSGAFQSVSPAPAAVQRGLNRFLSDARARQRLKALSGSSTRRGWLQGVFGRGPRALALPYRTGLAAAAVAVAVLAVAVGVASFSPGGGGTDGPVVGQPSQAPRTPAAVSDLSQRVHSVRSKVASGATVDPSEIAALARAARELGNIDPGAISSVRDEVAQTLMELDTLLQEIRANQPAVASHPAVQEAEEATREVAGVLGLELPTPTPVIGDTPAPTPVTTEPGPATTEPPTPEPTLAPTPEATPEPTPAPTEVIRPIGAFE